MTKLETGLLIGLIIIVVAAAGVLFGGSTYIKTLRLQIEGKTEKQDILQKDIDALNDSINNRIGRFSKLDKIITDAKTGITVTEGGIIKITEDYEDDITRIASDDVNTDFSATVKIFKEHNRNN